MNLEPGTYRFECDLMPWTNHELGLGVYGDDSMEVVIELTKEEIQDLVNMMLWAWDNEWFENSSSEMVFTELLKERVPHLFDRIQPLAHQRFCEKFPNSETVEGYGVYEIFVPYEIVQYARHSLDPAMRK